MYIEEIHIEGFKSYAQRTVVPAFDSKFNAITGLNGSGKSNILDSICFVLGITNLSQVRASNLQELVYKQGQAGITKATVSIVFNNSDTKRSPVGYEHFDQITVTRQIVIGGRNKYMINGHVAQPSRVQNLFHSVQLNVNNPHFLIMQGRITKVLNMKPPEILSMLEEAAGTRMYENKKEGALKTLEKKQAKVHEIDSVLKDEILPALEKLRKERAQYRQWIEGNTTLEKLRKFIRAFEFTEAFLRKTEATDGVEDKKREIVELESDIGTLDAKVSQDEGRIQELTAQKELAMGKEVQELSATVNDYSAALVKETSALTNCTELIAAEEKTLVDLSKSGQELEASIEKKAAAAKSLEERMSSMQAEEQTAAAELKTLQEEHDGLLAGRSGAGEEQTMEEKLSSLKAEVTEAGSEAMQATVKLKHLEADVKGKRKTLVTKQKDASALEEKLATVTREVEQGQEKLSHLNFDEARMASLETARTEQSERAKMADRRWRQMTADSADLDFQFQNLGPGFDRRRVKGLVARQFELLEPAAITALEVAAGGKLYNVITDTEVTAKLLLQRGGLRRRVTIIPLNKIRGQPVSPQVLAAAKRIAGADNVHAALDLVKFDPEVTAAMHFAFGGVLICRDADTAKKLFSHRDVRTRCVTLEGDLYNPAGTLTGGSRPRGGASILGKVHALQQAEEELRGSRAALAEVEAELASLAPMAKRHHKLTVELGLKREKLALMQAQVQQSEHHQLSEEISVLEVQLAEAKQVHEAATGRQRVLQEEVTALEQKMKDIGRDRDKMLKSLASQIKTAKAKLADHTKKAKDQGKDLERLGLEKGALETEKAGLAEQIAASEKQIETLKKQLAELEAAVVSCKNAYDAATEALAAKRRDLKNADKQIGALEKEVAKAKKSKDHKIQEIRKRRKAIEDAEKGREDACKRVDDMLKQFDWIHLERQLFGKPNTEYDFSSRNINQARAQVHDLQKAQGSMERQINKRVEEMFDRAEEGYKDLMTRKNIIENDKNKIQQVISELDEKKKQALQVTWEKVNRDFGSIFSTLLPGTMAKLDIPEGMTLMDGLEVKVAFGQVWKQSLSEMSGGQKSLLALSLILALLLFKPAPLYILDEVDAALDLSHTQNIGRMIKAHFPQSQFVVVSLKEGMFNNANVIFRTKFVDGISTVMRTVPSGAGSSRQDVQQEEAQRRKGKKPSETPRRRTVLQDSNMDVEA